MQELWFLHSNMKFHEDSLNGFQVKRTRFCERQTDASGKNNNLSPYPKGGDIITLFIWTFDIE